MRRKSKCRTLTTFLCIVVAAAFYVIHTNKRIDDTKYTISDDNIPKAFDNYKIAHISDLHSVDSWFQADKDKVIEKLIKNQPDIIVVTGDMIDADVESKKAITKKFMEDISKIAPVYYVLGNHESTLKKSLDSYLEIIDSIDNVTLMRNENIKITKDGESIYIVGIDDSVFSKGLSTLTMIANASEGIPEDAYRILLSHRPEKFNDYIESKVNLVYTGHAHGGQIRIPFKGSVFAPDQGLWPTYTEGVFEEDDTTMVISRGIGNSTSKFAKIRINNSPEVVFTIFKTGC